MITRFEKTLEQVAREGALNTDSAAIESRAQKVRRLEEIIRAKEVKGDRIVIGIGAALVVFAMALPVYASFVRETSFYLPSTSATAPTRDSLAADKLQLSSLSDTAAIKRENVSVRSTERSRQSGASRQDPSATPFARYFIHHATATSALIEGPNGLWWVTPGMKVPGIGQILSIERSDAGWAVVTSETTITEAIARNATN